MFHLRAELNKVYISIFNLLLFIWASKSFGSEKKLLPADLSILMNDSKNQNVGLRMILVTII